MADNPNRDIPAKLAGFRHPTCRWPERVALISLGATHQDYVRECLGRDLPPTVYGRDETWTLNRGIHCFRHDMAFVLDHLDGERAFFPRYGERIWNHDKPIITSQAEDWPAHVSLYPIDEIRRFFGPAHDYYHNSVPMIIAYAVWIGVKELTLWGADYHHERQSAREEDRPNAEYWVAIARERGCQVLLPATTTLCNANQQARVYGYRDQPAKPW